MKEFVFNNWRFLVVIVLDILAFVFALCKKRIKIVDSMKEYILSILPDSILSAESTFLDGYDKKRLVVNGVLELLKQQFPSLNINNSILSFIDKNIELILSTPKKKEVLKCEEKK